MPDPPPVSLITRFLLENPLPLAVPLIAVGALLVWRTLNGGKLSRLGPALGLVVAGIVALIIGWLVQTSGERARTLTRQFVVAIEAADVNGAIALLAPDATLAFDSPRNPGHDLSFITTQLRRLADQYVIASNSIAMLDGYSVSGEKGLTHLTCWTQVETGFGPVRTQWVVEVAPQTDGSWLISRITAVRINDEAASRYR